MNRASDTMEGVSLQRYVFAARSAAAAVVVMAGMIVLLGWALEMRWAVGALADGWPATTPWTATLFSAVGLSVLVGVPVGSGPSERGTRPAGRLLAALQLGLLGFTLVMSVLLLAQTIWGTRNLFEDLILGTAVQRVGGRFPGMPSIQTLTTLIVLSSAGILLVRGTMPRVRTVLLTTGLLMGLSGGISTIATAVRLSFGPDTYGYSVLTAAMSVLGAFSLTSIAPQAAPAVILRARAGASAVVLGAGAIIGTPAITLFLAAVRNGGGPIDAILGVVVFTTLALGLSWMAWFAMRVEIWRTVASSGTDAVVLLDRSGRIDSVDTGTTQLTGWTPCELVGRDASSLVLHANADVAALIAEVADSMRPAVLEDRPFELSAADGHSVDVSIRLLPTVTADGVRVIATLSDAAREAEYRRRSVQDPLTGVLNRRGLTSALETVLDESPLGTAVMFVDLDHFKRINDLASHAVGDEALRHVAVSLQRSVRSGDLVGRFGGDEFICVLSPVHNDRDLQEVAERLRRELTGTAFDTAEGRIEVTVSIGAAVARRHCTSETLLARADEALLEAKRSGRDRIVIAGAGPVADPRPDPRASAGSAPAARP